MPWSVVAVLAALLIVLLQTALWRRRVRIRRELLQHGTRVAGRVVTARPDRGDPAELRELGVLVVAYRSVDGVDRRAVKTPRRRGDAWMAGEPVAVVYDARRPTDPERMLVGFGRTKKTWFRAKPGTTV